MAILSDYVEMSEIAAKNMALTILKSPEHTLAGAVKTAAKFYRVNQNDLMNNIRKH